MLSRKSLLFIYDTSTLQEIWKRMQGMNMNYFYLASELAVWIFTLPCGPPLNTNMQMARAFICGHETENGY
jgi:hypothetical protein